MANAFTKESRIILFVLFLVVAVFTWLQHRDIAHDERDAELNVQAIEADDRRLDSLEARVKALEASKTSAPVAP